MTEYIAFLRGINVGGHKVAMQDLQTLFEGLGFSNVRTFIASGNVTFEADSTDTSTLTKTIESKLHAHFDFAIPTVLRTQEDLADLAASNPFKGAGATPQTKLYVTFVADAPSHRLATPYKHPKKDFTITHMSDNEICSVLTLTSTTGTTDLMKFLEGEFGKNITTRNWNTIKKVMD